MVKYYYAGSQRVAMRVGSNAPSYLLGDHLGSTSLTTNSSGGKVAELRYYPYGGTGFSSGTTPTSYQFTGQRNDSSIGLYFYNARYYDPALGRFLSADTIIPSPGNPQSLNRYSYVLNSPLKYIDPTGHREIIAEDENGKPILWTPATSEAAYDPKAETANISWGETAGLYPITPGLSKDAVTPAILYNPDQWDPTSVNQLLKARAAIEIIAKRNSKVQSGIPNLDNDVEKELMPYHAKPVLRAMEAEVDREVRTDRDVRLFYISPNAVEAHHPADNESQLVVSYGPFWNTGGGDVGRGYVYIHFYKEPTQ